MSHRVGGPFYLVWPLFSDILDPSLFTLRVSLCKSSGVTYGKPIAQFDININESDPKCKKYIVSAAESFMRETEVMDDELPVLVQLKNESLQDMIRIPIRRV